MKKDRLARPHTVLQKLCTQLVECSRYPERILFLDVETTGLDPYRDVITVIGWSFGGYARTLVRGMGSEPLREDLARAKFLVTFNGRSLRHEVPRTGIPGYCVPQGAHRSYASLPARWIDRRPKGNRKGSRYRSSR